MIAHVKLDPALPHSPSRIPVFGDVFSADRHRPTQQEMAVGHELGPVYERKLLSTRFPVVCGAALANDCSDEERWARALAGPTLKLRSIAHSGLFTARTSDPLWAQARRILDPGFTQAALRRYHAAITSVADDLVDTWRGAETVDVHDAMTNATLEVIARAGFSRNLGLFDHAADRDVTNLITAVGDVLTWASESSNDIPLIGQLRSARQQRAFGERLAESRAFIDEIVSERAASGADHDDLLGLMLHTADPETGEKLPLDNVRDQVLTMLIAGHETTAALLETTLWYLARRSDLVAAIRDETARRGLDYDGVAGLRTTRHILNEALRLWPPVPAYFRISRCDQQLGGYDIPAGQSVSVLVLAAQRDPAGWGPDADDFDPSRWEAKALRRYPDRFFQPFGTGPRSCIGRAFAMQEAALMVATIVAHFDLAPVDADDRREPVMLERGTLRPEPFRLRVTERGLSEASG